MPHGSGHGSHGGGHHHSSHHSSHHSGHHSSAPRTSRRPFRGSRRYRYYDRHGVSRYIYSSAPPRPMSLVSLIFSIIVLIPFLVIPIFMMLPMVSGMKAPKPLYANVCDGIHIEDNRGLFSDTDDLEKALEAFEDTTGICPRIITAYDSDWKKRYSDPEKYALSLYTERFKDEKHFVIVFSWPDREDSSGFVDWSWGGAQGDLTDSILFDSKVNKFFDHLHNNLKNPSLSPTQAFEKTFRESQSYIMDPEENSEYTLIFIAAFMGIWYICIIGSVLSMVKQYINGRRVYEEVPYDF